MRVLNSLLDSRIGGPQIRSLSVARRLRKQDIETEFLLPEGSDDFVRHARARGFKVHRPGLARIQPLKRVVNNTKYVLQFPQAVQRTRRIIRDRSIDIVHANMSVNFNTAIAAWLSDTALVWHFNDVLIPWPLNRIAGKTGDSIADELIVASGSVADHYFLKTTSNVSKIYAPVDVQKYNPDKIRGSGLRQELGLKEDTIIVGSIGNINPIKGHEYLLRAASKIKPKINQNIAFPIVGSVIDSREQYFVKLKEIREDLGLKNTVYFLGYRANIANILAQFDVFVLPSIADACPMSLLEAMAMQKPVIGTDVGGVPELIKSGESGWLVPPKDPEALVNAIVEVLENMKESHRRGKNARKKVIDEFSLERCVERHIEVYQQARNNH